ncbi:DNA-directed RNA polymerase subunit B'' [Candidatus Micrarchaeota archaeon CG10_big_fil_rev_8_21_14_0_10_45_29]|nr:MAG: DNA-directed RNA polymerase subunit B'' [Candidatus Micrarchaeota archaeon CG10_big_fil_rev_8_21_14_0_10_45_29]
MSKELLNAYFKENSLVKQHLDSYNKFVEGGMQEIIDRIGVIKPTIEGFELQLGRIRLDKPKVIEADGSQRAVLPSEARSRNLTYSAPIFLEIIPVYNGVEKKMFSEVFIGELPVMVKSKLCHLDNMAEDELAASREDPNDPGGYFIINGSERVLTSIEDLAPNRIMTTFEKDKKLVTSKVFSTRHGFRARSAVERTLEGMLYCVFPASPKDLGFVPVLRALGIEKNASIFSEFINDEQIRNDLLLNMEPDETKTSDTALDYVGKKAAPGQTEEYRKKRAEVLLDTYLLPHIGTDPADRPAKAKYLCKMCERAILVATKRIPADDKDHYANKRIKLTGDLMEELFRYAFQFLVKDVSYQAGRADARGRRLAVQTLVRPDALSDRIRYSMATGNWIAGQTGISQLLDRTSFLSSMSHLRRVVSPLSRKHPHFKARDLHGTHWGKICPNESPEGPSCALVKNMSLFCEISTGEKEEDVEQALYKFGVLQNSQ